MKTIPGFKTERCVKNKLVWNYYYEHCRFKRRY